MAIDRKPKNKNVSDEIYNYDMYPYWKGRSSEFVPMGVGLIGVPKDKRYDKYKKQMYKHPKGK